MTGPTLVTGASGFIGGNIARRLVAEGRPVRALVRATSDTSGLTGMELAVGDLGDGASLARAAAGCATVVHCAALVSDWATIEEIAAVNVAGTARLLEACRAAGVRRLVHVSTTDVYGHPGVAQVDETRPPGPFANWYAQTKLEAEVLVRDAGLEWVIVRPATVYGPGSVDVVGQIADAVLGGHMVLIDHGRANAGLAYVDNVADLVGLALLHPGAAGETFNATDGLDVTWRRFVADLAAGLGGSPARWSLPYGLAQALGLGLEQGYRLARRATGLTTAPLLSRQAVQVMGIDQDFSNARARARLGWAPRVGYAEGLAATLDWLRSRTL
jgi:nucleoside-diphosphate-sugar epimerase